MVLWSREGSCSYLCDPGPWRVKDAERRLSVSRRWVNPVTHSQNSITIGLIVSEPLTSVKFVSRLPWDHVSGVKTRREISEVLSARNLVFTKSRLSCTSKYEVRPLNFHSLQHYEKRRPCTYFEKLVQHQRDGSTGSLGGSAKSVHLLPTEFSWLSSEFLKKKRKLEINERNRLRLFFAIVPKINSFTIPTHSQRN